jgi:hypothetical protein
MIGKAKKEVLDRHGAIYGVLRRRRRFWSEGDRRYRARVLAVIEGNLYTTTKTTIEKTIEAFCTGLKRAEVSVDSPGSIAVKLEHKWWALPWIRANRRRASEACSKTVAVGTCWRVK